MYVCLLKARNLIQRRNQTGKTCRYLSVNMMEPCFVYMKEAISTLDFSALPESNVTKGTPLN